MKSFVKKNIGKVYNNNFNNYNINLYNSLIRSSFITGSNFNNNYKKFSSSSNTKTNYKLNEKLLNGVHNQIIDYLSKLKRKESKVIDFKTPDELRKLFPLSLEDNKRSNDSELLDYTQKVLDYSVHCGHHNYHNTLFGSFDERAIAGEFVASALNGNVYTYELAPIFTLMEEEIAKRYKNFLQWKNLDYVFCPGGSYANFYGITTARSHKYPDYKNKGLKHYPQMKLFIQESAHYSIQKASILCGFGMDNVIKIKTDEKNKMRIDELEKAIQRESKDGSVPLAVVSTLGTTVYGAFDPITEIDKVCKAHGIWHHVDACLGSAVLFFEEEFRKREPGITSVDSIAVDLHKVFNIPQQCTMFLTSHENILMKANSTAADYLFMKDKILYDAKLDKGDKSFQCGRHIDVLKLWLFWKYHSTDGIRKLLQETLDNAKYLAKLAKEHPNFELLIEPEFNNVSFFYFPDRLKNKEKTKEVYEETGKLAPLIKAEMVRKGSLMTAYQVMKFNDMSYPNFFRPSISFGKDKEDMEFIINEIHEIGKNL